MTNPELAPDMPELLPCPFCGGKAFLDTYSVKGKTYYQANCENCDCRTGSWYPNEQAAQSWNRRRADLAPQAGSVDVEGLRKELRKISDQTENSGGWHFVDKIIDLLASRNLLAGAPVGGDRPAIPGLQEAQGWQTVENVPRDQDVLVGYLNHAGEVEDVSVAYVSEGEKYHINSIYAEPRGDCRHCGGACNRVYVTHWMPLPAAPRDGRD